MICDSHNAPWYANSAVFAIWSGLVAIFNGKFQALIKFGRISKMVKDRAKVTINY